MVMIAGLVYAGPPEPPEAPEPPEPMEAMEVLLGLESLAKPDGGAAEIVYVFDAGVEGGELVRCPITMGVPGVDVGLDHVAQAVQVE